VKFSLYNLLLRRTNAVIICCLVSVPVEVCKVFLLFYGSIQHRNSVLLSLQPLGDTMQKVKKVFHSFKELQEEWQRQGIVKPDDTRIKNFRLVSSPYIIDNLEKFVVETEKQ